jgi:hypothetical protein
MSRMAEIAHDAERTAAMFPTREMTCKVLELMDEGLLDPKELVESLLMWLSEDDVRKMVIAYGIDELFHEEDEEE